MKSWQMVFLDERLRGERVGQAGGGWKICFLNREVVYRLIVGKQLKTTPALAEDHLVIHVFGM